jgi:hypothetical protein
VRLRDQFAEHDEPVPGDPSGLVLVGLADIDELDLVPLEQRCDLLRGVFGVSIG